MGGGRGLAVRGSEEGADEDSPHFPVSERRPGVLQEEASTLHDQVLLRQQHFEGTDLQCALAFTKLVYTYLLNSTSVRHRRAR